MNISIWYVYLDTIDKWVSDNDIPANSWVNAKEFFTEFSAKEAAEEVAGVVLGWCQ